MMNNVKNKRLIWTVLFMWLYFLTPIRAASEDSVDVQEIVFSHIQDAYTWHITEWNGKEIAIPLPVLIKSEERGWDLFLSHHLHQNQIHNNYYIATDGEYAGKIVEKNSLGEEVRPIDLSLTKNVCGLLLSCCILLFIILRTARWYKKHPNEVPDGFTGLMEMAVTYLQENVIKESIGKEYYKPFSSYLLTVFFFILINNLIGVIPIFPGGANVTGNITITFVLAICTFFAVNLFATKDYWKEIFWPKVPIYLKLPLPNMSNFHYGFNGYDRKSWNDCSISPVLRIHELSGTVCRLFTSIYIHFAFRQLYRPGKSQRINYSYRLLI